MNAAGGGPVTDERQGRLSRRACLASLAAGPAAWLGVAAPAHAGSQLEEPLIDSVRTALSSAVADLAPPEPLFASTEARLLYLRWLGTMSDRLRRRKPEWEVRRDFLQTVWYESKRSGLDVSLVMGLIQVESAFRKFAVSPVGARGYMQVMPFWTRVIGSWRWAATTAAGARRRIRAPCSQRSATGSSRSVLRTPDLPSASGPYPSCGWPRTPAGAALVSSAAPYSTGSTGLDAPSSLDTITWSMR